jgi:hypothetical protein
VGSARLNTLGSAEAEKLSTKEETKIRVSRPELPKPADSGWRARRAFWPCC